MTMNTTPSSMDYLQDSIDNVRMNLLLMKEKREEERQLFTDNQIEHAKRQHLCYKGLERLQRPKVAVPPRYSHVMLALSNVDYSPYVIARETELCRALHLNEVYIIQLQLITKHHKNNIKAMKQRFDKETLASEELEENMVRKIKYVSIDMTGRIAENQERLEKQREQLSVLREEISNSRDVSLSPKEEMEGVKSSSFSDLFHTRNIMDEENQRMSIEQKIIKVGSLSNLFLTRNKMDRENRRMSMERTIIKVGSYLGVIRTANAA